MKEQWSSLASILGTVAFSQTILHALVPAELRHVAMILFRRVSAFFSGYCYFDIMDVDGVRSNELYEAVHLYLGSILTIDSTQRLTLTKSQSSGVTCSVSDNDTLIDSFGGVQFHWTHVVTQRQSQSLTWHSMPDEKRRYTLRMKRKHRGTALEGYLDHIMAKAGDIRRRRQERQLYTNSRGEYTRNAWESVPFKHPSTFETLAMEPGKKKEIMDDLDDFSKGKGFYEKTGRAWKRGYLLYGPPGTGKSSLIAAMANHLKYDIYDLELTEVQTNSELRKLLMKTCPKSLIVIEDIDCSINLRKRKESLDRNTSSCEDGKEGAEQGSGESSVTLAGLLNFTDGLWSSCGSERIFVFTTNHIEKLDPALLRSGRMDMRIKMSYCDGPGLKILLQNYLEVGEEDGELVKDLELVIDQSRVTPADVSEFLLRNRRDKSKALLEMLTFLKEKSKTAIDRSLNRGDENERY